MNKQTEALMMAKQHIIERKGGRGGAVCYVKSDEDVIKAIDEALEQPAQEYLTRAQQVIRANNSAQEPVAKGFIRSLVSIDKNGIETWKEEPFYTSPPSWQGLSDDKINVIWDDVSDVLGFAKAIEAELKEKNAK